MFKLYKKINATYQDPEIYRTYKEAKDRASGEYLIIKRENGTDEIIEHGEIKNNKKKKRNDYER